MANNELKGTRRANSANTPGNAISFLIDSMIRGRINTMTPVVVLSVDATGSEGAAGRVSVRPLVSQRDADGNALDMAECFELPYMRYQGGKVAIVADPQPGDIGIAIYAQTDTSNVKDGTTEPVQPGSFRTFSQSDGWYIGGFLNQAPETFVELKQDGEIVVNAPTKIVLDSPLVEIAGKITQTGSKASGSTWTGGLTNTGGSLTSNGVVLESHTHGGVTPGGGRTGTP